MKRVIIVLSLILQGCGNANFSLHDEKLSMGYDPEYNNKADILFVIDNSNSMAAHQKILSESTAGLIAELKRRELDYHIAVTTTDVSRDGEAGRFVGEPKVITRNTSNAEKTLESKLLRGTEGSSLERGLEAVKLALTYPLVDEVNAGFMRPDAILVIIVLSNENDYSSSPVPNYIEWLNSLKPPTEVRDRNWVLNFVGVLGTPEEDCATFGDDYKDPGIRYMEASKVSGGISATICTTSLRQSVLNVQKVILTYLTEVKLERLPVVESIEVTFNGEIVPNDSENGWTYHSDGNVVRFHGSYVPKSKTKIEIKYDPVGPK